MIAPLLTRRWAVALSLAFALGLATAACQDRVLPALAAWGDQYAVDLGDGTAQVYEETPEGAAPVGGAYVITPPAPAPDASSLVIVPRGADVTPLLLAAAQRRGASDAVLLRIARCESHLGTDPRTYRADLVHRGVFQFNRATWQEQAPRYGVPASWDAALDPYWNTDLAAALLAHGEAWRWPHC